MFLFSKDTSLNKWFAEPVFSGNDTTAEVIQENHYYPFGMEFSGTSYMYGQPDNPYMYQGKENHSGQQCLNLNLYDFGARMFDGQTGKWNVPDPRNQGTSPYCAMGNNPVGNVDPDGCYYKPGMLTNYWKSVAYFTYPWMYMSQDQLNFIADPFGEHAAFAARFEPGGFLNSIENIIIGNSDYANSRGAFDTFLKANGWIGPGFYQFRWNGDITSQGNDAPVYSEYIASAYEYEYEFSMALYGHTLKAFHDPNAGYQMPGHRPGEYGVQYASSDGGYSGDNIFLKAWSHYQFGRGTDLNVSTSALDFSFVSQKDLSYNAKNNTYSVNLFSLNKTSQTSLVLGKVSLNPVGNNLFTINPDLYDFNIEWNQGFSTRNIGTLGAGLIHGPVIDNVPIPAMPLAPFFGPSFYFGGNYNVNFQGTIYIKP